MIDLIYSDVSDYIFITETDIFDEIEQWLNKSYSPCDYSNTPSLSCTVVNHIVKLRYSGYDAFTTDFGKLAELHVPNALYGNDWMVDLHFKSRAIIPPDPHIKVDVRTDLILCLDTESPRKEFMFQMLFAR